MSRDFYSGFRERSPFLLLREQFHRTHSSLEELLSMEEFLYCGILGKNEEPYPRSFFKAMT